MHVPRQLRRRLGNAIASGALAVAAVVAPIVAWTVVSRGMFVAPVLSPSMKPSFAAGDLVVTRRHAVRSIVPGEVLQLPLPDAPGQTYVHRVVSVERRKGAVFVRTKGDANPSPDAWEVGLASGHVPLVVASVPRLGVVGGLLRHGALRIGVAVAAAVCALVAVKRLLLEW